LDFNPLHAIIGSAKIHGQSVHIIDIKRNILLIKSKKSLTNSSSGQFNRQRSKSSAFKPEIFASGPYCFPAPKPALKHHSLINVTGVKKGPAR